LEDFCHQILLPHLRVVSHLSIVPLSTSPPLGRDFAAASRWAAAPPGVDGDAASKSLGCVAALRWAAAPLCVDGDAASVSSQAHGRLVMTDFLRFQGGHRRGDSLFTHRRHFGCHGIGCTGSPSPAGGVLQIAGGVMRTAMEMILTADGLRHGAAAITATWQQTAGAAIWAIALLIRANHRLVNGLFGFFRDRQVNLSSHLLSDVDSTFHGAASMSRVTFGARWTTVLVIVTANRVGDWTTAP